MKTLVIEAEQDIAKNIKNSLEKESYLVEIASNYAATSEKIPLYQYYCVLLDITLPDGSGLGVAIVQSIAF